MLSDHAELTNPSHSLTLRGTIKSAFAKDFINLSPCQLYTSSLECRCCQHRQLLRKTKTSIPNQREEGLFLSTTCDATMRNQQRTGKAVFSPLRWVGQAYAGYKLPGGVVVAGGLDCEFAVAIINFRFNPIMEEQAISRAYHIDRCVECTRNAKSIPEVEHHSSL